MPVTAAVRSAGELLGIDPLHVANEGKALLGVAPEAADPDDFIRWGFAELIAHRAPRYQAIADRWGVTVEADEIAAVETEADFTDLIAAAIDRRAD